MQQFRLTSTQANASSRSTDSDNAIPFRYFIQSHFRLSIMKRVAIAFTAVLFLMILAAPKAVNAQAGQQLNQESAMHYSLYYENFKAKNYADAVQDLHWILQHDPAFPRNKDQNFDRGVELYTALADAEADPTRRRVHLDSALAILDRAVPVMQAAGGEIDVFEWTLRKGRFIQAYIDVLEDIKDQAIDAYWACYRLDPMQLDPYYLNVLVGDLYTGGDIGGALDLLREIKDTRGEEVGVKGIVTKYFVAIPPEEQIAFLEEQLAEKAGDAEITLQLFDLYQQEAYHGKMMELAPQVLALDPTPEVLRLVSRMYLEDGDAEQAMAVFEQLKALPGVEIVAQDYHNMGIAHQDQESFGKAMSFYQQALELDPEYDEAKVAIANLYATAASTCGIDGREQAAVFWLIADAYSRAGDAAGAARMRTAFPTAEDIFYVQKWTVGESTQISYSCRGLNISGTTTVRQQ